MNQTTGPHTGPPISRLSNTFTTLAVSFSPPSPTNSWARWPRASLAFARRRPVASAHALACGRCVTHGDNFRFSLALSKRCHEWILHPDLHVAVILPPGLPHAHQMRPPRQFSGYFNTQFRLSFDSLRRRKPANRSDFAVAPIRQSPPAPTQPRTFILCGCGLFS